MQEKALLILDVDETLIHGAEEPLDRECDFRVGRYYVYRRPYLSEFLTRVGGLYRVACWSSSTMDYLAIIISEIMLGLDCTPVFAWDRSRCIEKFDMWHQQYYFLKDLSKLEERGFDLQRVLIVDDDPRKVSRNCGNAIYVKPFMGERDDDELPALAEYLALISEVPDFLKVEKRGWRRRLT